MALLNPGDEVLLFEPFYGYHVNTLKSLRVNPVLVALAEPDWQLDVDAMRAAVTPRTRAILLNTPANPSGKIFTLPELEAVAQLCHRARSLPHHRRNLRVLRLRRRAAHLPRHAARHARAHHRDLRLQQDVFDHRLARGLRDGRCALDAGHGALPRPDLRVRARAFPDWRGRGPGAVAAELLHASGRRSPIEARTAAGRARRRGHEAVACPRAPITSWPAPSACPAKPPRKRRATCCARPAWPP